jgi:hypothetical protein
MSLYARSYSAVTLEITETYTVVYFVSFRTLSNHAAISVISFAVT